jgi:HEAT repeat protein
LTAEGASTSEHHVFTLQRQNSKATTLSLATTARYDNNTTLKKKRRSAVFILLLAALVVGSLLYYFLQTSEPSWQGKTLSRWISGLEAINVNPTDEQRAALHAMGEPAVTHLIATLRRRDSLIKRKFVAYAQHHADIHNRFIAPMYIIPEDLYHAQAATALGEIGPAARTAIPALMAESTNSDEFVAARARAALIKIRQEPITPLLATIANTSSTNWYVAVLTAKFLGTNGESVVPLLVNSLQGSNIRGARVYSLWALQGIASRPDIAVPALTNSLQDSNPDIRLAAVAALCEFKEAKEEVVPLLIARIQLDPDRNVWYGASRGLEKLVNQDEKRTLYVPALVKSLTNQNEAIRENAKMFLKRIDPQAAANAGIK